MKKIIDFLKKFGIVIGLFLFIFVIAYILHLFGVLESYQQFVVVLVSVAATYIIVCLTMSAQSKEQAELQNKLSESQAESQLKLQQKLSESQNELQKKLMEKEDRAKRDLEIYNAKLGVYSDFVSSMYEALKDNKITADEFIDLRTELLGKVCFYVNNKEVLEGIKKELDNVKDLTNDNKIAKAFAGITNILQKDLKRDDWIDSKQDVLDLWGKFEEISANTNDDSETTNTVPVPKNDNQQEDKTPDQSERLEQQAWHFIMWDDSQLVKLKEGFKELSLVEYGEDWRTNLVKQVSENDVIMLFRRGGYGYVGAYRAVGRRIFYFEENREEIQIFGKELQVITGEQYLSDIKEYDIYESQKDGATTCANIIVEPIAFIENGIGNPGGVYRRTISRYDSHYAWLLKKSFQEKGQWK